MARPTSDVSGVTDSPAEYGMFVICTTCSRRSDIWEERCACGIELLPDDRKVKLAKSGATPFARMTRRADHLDSVGTTAAREQAVRDLAALRASVEGKKWDFTPRIVHDLIALGRIDEACAEAETLVSRGDRGTPSSFAIEAVARELTERRDDRAERWLRLALDRMGASREHLELQCALVGLLSAAGREPEALDAFEQAVAELGALRKRTSKSTMANLSGSTDAFTAAYWSQATNALDLLRGPVVGASAAVAATVGRDALSEVQRLERGGEITEARDAASAAADRIAIVARRLKPLAAGLPKAEGKTAIESVEGVVRSLETEVRRLKKLAKRS